MKTRKFIIFLVIIAGICTIPAHCSGIINNNLTIINKIYKIVCDIDESRTFEENEKLNEPEKSGEIKQEIETGKKEKKYIALTFDDGPHPKYTGEILNVLSEKKAPATFFIVGNRAELHPTLLRRIKQADCEIGNHTYNHVDLSQVSRNEFISQMEKCNQAIYNATGEYPKVYRPPFGRISKANEEFISDKMRKILWTVDSLDWKTKEKDKIVKQVVTSARNKAIILMHDFYSQSVEALPDIIDKLRDEGYEFVTVSELKELSDLPDRMEYFIN